MGTRRAAHSGWTRLQQLIGNRSLAESSQGIPALLQPKLLVGPVDDPFEREADAIADRVMRSPLPGARSITSVASHLQRCACGGTCDRCRAHDAEDNETLRRAPAPGVVAPSIAPPIAARALRSPGAPLPPVTRAWLESSLGSSLAAVRVHDNPLAALAARSVGARAFTVGQDIIFGRGEYAPASATGRRLLAHELVHTVQQAGAASPRLQRAPSGEPKAADFKAITMHFDGGDLTVMGDGRELFRFSGQSGRPVPVSEADAKACGADQRLDSYMNDGRFVGIKDQGPIPEATYTFRVGGIERFDTGEQLSLLWGGIRGADSVKVHGHGIHPGDWGSGRVELHPVAGTVKEGPCGKASTRSAFFLHGGIMSGSSGCIDIGGDFGKLAEFLGGYPRAIRLTVKYTATPPSIRWLTGLSGAVAYKAFDFRHGPRLSLGTEFGGGTLRFTPMATYDATLAWAGGTLSAGLRLQVPMTDKEAFVRAGLEGATNFRILGGLYGRLFAGVSVPLGGPESGPAFFAGGGLRYDFGRVQLEALYDVLRPFSDDERLHGVMIGIGFEFGRR